MIEPENPLVTKLREELRRRQDKNPKYSLRAFAFYLGMDPSNLSKIFRGERALSNSCIETLTRKLYGDGALEETFMSAVKESARAQRRQMNEPFQQSPFPVAESGEWHHFVLMEVSRIMRINATTIPWISESLEVPREMILESLNDLIHWNIVEEKFGEFHFKRKNLSTMSIKGTSESLKAIQKVFLAMATRAIDIYDTTERENTTLTIAVSAEQIPLIKSLLSKTRKKVNKMSEMTSNKKLFAVYNLTMSLYPVTKELP